MILKYLTGCALSRGIGGEITYDGDYLMFEEWILVQELCDVCHCE